MLTLFLSYENLRNGKQAKKKYLLDIPGIEHLEDGRKVMDVLLFYYVEWLKQKKESDGTFFEENDFVTVVNGKKICCFKQHVIKDNDKEHFTSNLDMPWKTLCKNSYLFECYAGDIILGKEHFDVEEFQQFYTDEDARVATKPTLKVDAKQTPKKKAKAVTKKRKIDQLTETEEPPPSNDILKKQSRAIISVIKNDGSFKRTKADTTEQASDRLKLLDAMKGLNMTISDSKYEAIVTPAGNATANVIGAIMKKYEPAMASKKNPFLDDGKKKDSAVPPNVDAEENKIDDDDDEDNEEESELEEHNSEVVDNNSDDGDGTDTNKTDGNDNVDDNNNDEDDETESKKTTENNDVDAAQVV